MDVASLQQHTPPTACVGPLSASARRRSSSGAGWYRDWSRDRQALGRIVKLQLAEKGVPAKDVDRRGGYREAARGEVHILPGVQPRAEGGFPGRLQALRYFLECHFPHLGLHEWNPAEKIGLPPEDPTHPAWKEFERIWVAKDEEEQKQREAEKKAAPAQQQADLQEVAPDASGALPSCNWRLESAAYVRPAAS